MHLYSRWSAVSVGDWVITGRWKALGWKPAPERVESRAKYRHPGWLISLVAGALTVLMALDLHNSFLQAHILTAIARRMTYSLHSGPSSSIHYPPSGPYDLRLGYARLPVFVNRLQQTGYRVVAQARDSKASVYLSRLGLFPVWREKSQAGLTILDRNSQALYDFRYPHKVYAEFADIPPLVVNTLLFIENRHILDPNHPYRNPAIEWDRFSRAVIDLGVHTVDHNHALIGGSTLATQLEKMRHSPEGRTHSVRDKFWQMASASVAAYQGGPETMEAQKRIISDYINSIPLAALQGQGEITGLADGLASWYGADFATVNRLLAANEASLSPAMQAERARAYRQVLSLFLALREPNWYLVKDPGALAVQTDRYLRALCDKGIISARLRDLALAEPSTLRRPQGSSTPRVNFVAGKGANAIRVALLSTLGLPSTYDLDRLDLTVRTTLDTNVQNAVTKFLQQVQQPEEARKAGLDAYHLLDYGNPQRVIYSFVLYERDKGANVLRVETDNYNAPLNINRGTRLELGSTAKLRTLINYLQIVAGLHAQYANMTPAQLASVPLFPDDNLSAWAIQYLSTAQDKSLPAMLQAALDRKYSANPWQGFFTAGGLHYFQNFEKSDDDRILTVREAFHRSVNLVFIRLMRDIEHYYWYRVPGASPAIFQDAANPGRRVYLSRFADQEGTEFLDRFYSKYLGQTADQRLETVLRGLRITPLRLAVIYRSVRPQAGIEPFTAYLKAHLPANVFVRQDPASLYGKYAIDKFNLSDRGYLAHVHPLELWMLNYLEQHPDAGLDRIVADSAQQRQEVYGWLFHSHFKAAQDKRIGILMEQDAFKEICKAWRRLGYPFDSLVPSLATTIGVSGDTPAALANLVGILENDGVKYPTVRVSTLHFGAGTPTETILDHKRGPIERLLPPEIVKAVRQEMIGVVEAGTGQRAYHSIALPNGKFVPVGGKTGTGDNRFDTFAPGRRLISSRIVNRTATFIFFIGDRFFGAVTAFVPGQVAGGYGFTSALPVQIFRDLAPALKPLLVPSSRMN